MVRKFRVLMVIIIALTAVIPYGPALAEESQLTTVHFLEALWKGDPRIPEDIKNNKFDFIVLTQEGIDGGQDGEFHEQAGRNFILRADGYQDVQSTILSGFGTSHGSGYQFTVINLNEMVSGVQYRIIAPSRSDTYKWVVSSGVTITKGDNTGDSGNQTPPPQNNNNANPTAYGSDIDPNYNQSEEPMFSDVGQNHWAFTAINALAKMNVLSGYPDGKFRPNRIVSRAEFAKIMVAAAGLQPRKVTSTSFADIKPSDWFTPFVESAKYYLNGYKTVDGNIVYRPGLPALREDIAIAMVKLKGYNSNRFPDLSILEAMFTDYQSISNYAMNYIALAVENKLISGYPDETIRPQRPLTRAEAAAIIYKAYQYGNDNKVGIVSEIPSEQEQLSNVGIPVLQENQDSDKSSEIIYIIPGNPQSQTPSVTDSVYGN